MLRVWVHISLWLSGMVNIYKLPALLWQWCDVKSQCNSLCRQQLYIEKPSKLVIVVYEVTSDLIIT